MTHTTELFCPLCEQKLSECHSVLKDLYRDIKLQFKDCHISWGYRNQQDQELFFTEHKTLAHYPHSKHNVTKDSKPYSRALDLFQLDPDGRAQFSPRYYVAIADFVDQKKFPLFWAGSWTQTKDHFVETDHFQLNEDVI